MENNLMEQNVFIIWKPEYNLGIPIIDEQHRGIVSTINSLHFGMQTGYIRDILKAVIDMMYDYTRIHFEVEEEFLAKIDYPNAQKHHMLHLDLSSKLSNASRNSLLGKDPHEFMDFLKNWWINHICHEDLIFRNFLVELIEKQRADKK